MKNENSYRIDKIIINTIKIVLLTGIMELGIIFLFKFMPQLIT